MSTPSLRLLAAAGQLTQQLTQQLGQQLGQLADGEAV
jgi:hypothetical protein